MKNIARVKVQVLGSGTSTGIPVPGCDCDVCRSPDKRNKRLRTSILIDVISPGHPPATEQIAGRILVDTSPDLRYQALRAGVKSIDAVLYTHTHADHVFGIDDLRSFNFMSKNTVPLYASDSSARELEHRFHYAFFPDPDYEGGAPPRLTLTRLPPYLPLNLFDAEFIPLPLLHGRMEVFGYRVGNFAYLTDCSAIPDRTREYLQGLDTLIIDGLRRRPHKTHFTLRQAVDEVEKLGPRQSYLIHISHEVEHHEANEELKTFTKRAVELAYDGLVLDV